LVIVGSPKIWSTLNVKNRYRSQYCIMKNPPAMIGELVL
jgi:hypothetical protein